MSEILYTDDPRRLLNENMAILFEFNKLLFPQIFQYPLIKRFSIEIVSNLPHLTDDQIARLEIVD
jgi:hypothetical protein